MQKNHPLISVIIATLNCAQTLPRCLQSIFNQTYAEKELIVMDGGSDDETVLIAKSFESEIAYFESAPDNGIYHAWNKALNHAQGQWICFLGADDCFYDPNVLNKVSTHLNQASIQGSRLIYGQVVRTDEAGHTIRILGKPWEKISWQIRHGMPIHLPHPGMMHHRSLFEEYGFFDESFKIAGDYEFILRELKNVNKQAFHLEFPTVKSRIGGIAEANQFAALKEVRKARLRNGLSPSWLGAVVYFRAVMRRILQKFFKMPQTSNLDNKK